MKKLIFAALLACAATSQARQAIDAALAKQYFDEAAQAAQADDGALWGVSLAGPILFVEQQSRTIAANQADEQGLLIARDGIFVGTLPAEVGIANTAIEWAGVRWTMVIWPLPEQKPARVGLIMHELFHRIQSEIGFAANNPDNSHLDEMQARVLLQLEWRALLQALRLQDETRNRHLINAQLFRVARLEHYPHAAENENTLELNEGLAEYTGLRLSGRTNDQILSGLADKVERAGELPSFVRSFAYTSGPLYAILLDQQNAGWRAELAEQRNLGELLARAYGISVTSAADSAFAIAARLYRGDTLQQYEQKRENDRLARLATLRKKLVTGPVLVMPFQAPNLSFNPNNLQPLGEHGTVYTGIYLSDVWGVFETSAAALVASDWSKATISAAGLAGNETGKITGDGWTLELKAGWVVAAGIRPGDFHLKQEN